MVDSTDIGIFPDGPETPDQRVAIAIQDLVLALDGLRMAKEGARATCGPRDVSIAITHIEEAILRLRHGTST